MEKSTHTKKEQNLSKRLKELLAKKRMDEMMEELGFKKLPKLITCIILHAQDYVEKDQLKLAAQLNKMALIAPTYASKYGYSAGDLAQMVKDAAYFQFYVTNHGGVPDYAKAWTTKGDDMLFGTGTVVSAWPVGADVSTPPADVANGIVARYREFAQRAKSQKRIYKVADGLAMGFESAHSAFVPGDGKPAPVVALVHGGHPQIRFIIDQFQMLEIQVDRGDGKGMVALDKTKNTHYVDNTTLPAAGVSAVWTYQMIYWFADERVGSWSETVSVTVKGY